MAVGEWDQRQLCLDGSCIGVIGPDGTCKVCGRAAPHWGDERNRGLLPPDDEERDIADDDDDDLDDDDEDDLDGDDGDGDDDDDDDDLDGGGDDDGEAGGEDLGDRGANGLAASGAEREPRGEWGERRLCSNGACIGVIGDDGRCKVCGRPASDSAVEPTTAAAAPVSHPGERAPVPAPAPEAAAPEASPAPPAITAPEESPAPPAIAAPEVSPAIPALPAIPAPPAIPAAVTAAAEASDRERCADTSCSGAIGANGRCEVCGKGAS